MFLLFQVAVFLEKVYTNDNRTSRTSPRQRVMCPREDIFLVIDIMGIVFIFVSNLHLCFILDKNPQAKFYSFQFSY